MAWPGWRPVGASGMAGPDKAAHILKGEPGKFHQHTEGAGPAWKRGRGGTVQPGVLPYKSCHGRFPAGCIWAYGQGRPLPPDRVQQHGGRGNQGGREIRLQPPCKRPCLSETLQCLWPCPHPQIRWTWWQSVLQGNVRFCADDWQREGRGTGGAAQAGRRGIRRRGGLEEKPGAWPERWHKRHAG